MSTKQIHVGIVGGGIAGSTAALRLSELGIKVSLFESGPSLVNGPPVCHLHAGGNLYREISDEQCVNLLHQSIDTIRYYPNTINYRPTIIAVPKRDKGCMETMIKRLDVLVAAYKKMIAQDPANEVLGPADEYYKIYDRDELERLAELKYPESPTTLDEWMIPVAKSVDFNDFHFPFYAVHEYGISLFRVAATVALALKEQSLCDVYTNSKVNDVEKIEGGWRLSSKSTTVEVDFLVNACGYKTGEIDDMVGFHRQRMVEFKAAYLVQWPDLKGLWPEVIFHGLRGTPDGMGEVTPYANGYFQLHGMTDEITLFKEGLAKNCHRSAQPKLPKILADKAEHRWPEGVAEERTEKAVGHIAKLVPSFLSARFAGKPLYGAQQIPGEDPSLRVADVSFEGDSYARTEIVKLSSALSVAEEIYHQLERVGLVEKGNYIFSPENSKSASTSLETVEKLACSIAQERGYPIELGKDYSEE